MSLLLKRVVPITLFNKGQASRQFRRVQEEGSLVVIRNNTPIAVIVPPEEYEILRSLFRICKQELIQDGAVFSNQISEMIEQIRAFDERDDT